MNPYKKYQYYILLEINNGILIQHRVLKFAENSNYKIEIRKSFYKMLLNTAENEQIKIINICDGNYEHNGKYIWNRITNYNNWYNWFISKLIATDCDNFDVVNDDISVPNEDFSDSDTYYNGKSYRKPNFERARLAIYHYIFNKTDKYISDFSTLKKIESFYYKYLINHRLTFNTLEYKHIITQTPEVINTIRDICSMTPHISTCFLSRIGTFREQDLSYNYGLFEFEQGYEGGYNYEGECYEWITPSTDDVQSAWAIKEAIWNEKYINDLQKISQEDSVRFFLMTSFDYPINNLQTVYNPL